MSATRLLVLAFVRAHDRAHGYLVGQELLAWDADKWANTKAGSIYHALRQLTKEGLLMAIEVPGSDLTPGRTDYSITPAGEEHFQKLMAEALIRPTPRPDMLCAGLAFMSALPRATVVDYLRQRRSILEAQRADVVEANRTARWDGESALPSHIEALLSFWTHNTASSHDWIDDLIRKIEAGAYVFADDDPKSFGSPGSRITRM